MNKCRKCGKEFEGNFCPECGEKVEPVVIFSEFENDEANAGTTVKQADTVKIKKPFEFAFVSKITGRILSIMMAAIFTLCGACIALLIKDIRDFAVIYSDGAEQMITNTPFLIAAGILGVGCLGLAAICIISLTNKKPILNYPDLMVRRKEYKKFLRLIAGAVVIEFIFIYAYIFTGYGMLWILIALFALLISAYIAVILVGLSFIKKIEEKYITKNSDGTITNELTPLVSESVENIKAANALREKRYNTRREGQGKAPKTAREIEREYQFRKIGVAACAVIIAAIIFIVSIAVPRNIFDIDQIEKISVGDSISYVTRLFGEPYDKKETTDNNKIVKGGTYSYCSSSLVKQIANINRKLEKLEDADDFDDLEEMFKLSDQLVQLEEQLAKTRCDYIFVSFENYKITAISFLKDRYYDGILKSEVIKVTYAVADSKDYYKYGNSVTVDKNSSKVTVNARLYFNDGSLLNKQIEVEINPLQVGTQNITWSDMYGRHEIKVEVK